MTYTQAQIDSAKDQLVTCMASNSSTFYQGLQLGYCACNYQTKAAFDFIMYEFLNNWHQTTSGNPAPYYNAGTAAQLDAVMKWISINCTC